MPGPKIDRQNVLLVEGSNDQQFIYQLANRAGIPRDDYRIPTWEKGGGFQTVVDSLPGILVGSVVQHLGIVVDADDDPISRWRSLTNKLHGEGYNLPSEPAVGGLVHREQGKRIAVGIWLMPDNLHPGMLEDMAFELLPTGDLLWPHAVDVVTRISELEQRFKPTYTMKAQLHTWLAWQDEPGTQLGLAVKRRYLQGDAPLAADFVHWLKRLFELL
jgi:hypothetical protein